MLYLASSMLAHQHWFYRDKVFSSRINYFSSFTELCRKTFPIAQKLFGRSYFKIKSRKNSIRFYLKLWRSSVIGFGSKKRLNCILLHFILREPNFILFLVPLEDITRVKDIRQFKFFNWIIIKFLYHLRRIWPWLYLASSFLFKLFILKMPIVII